MLRENLMFKGAELIAWELSGEPFYMQYKIGWLIQKSGWDVRAENLNSLIL